MHYLIRYTLEQKVKVILYLIQVEQSTLILGVDARKLRLWTHSGKAEDKSANFIRRGVHHGPAGPVMNQSRSSVHLKFIGQT